MYTGRLTLQDMDLIFGRKMQMIKTVIAGVSAFCFCGLAMAGEANMVAMAHGVGFKGCDTLITDAFEYALKASDRRVTIDYFEETAKDSIGLTATYGSPGDSVWTTTHFVKRNGVCYSSIRTVLSEVGNCAGVLSKDKYFKYVADAGGTIWAKNAGGVTKLLTQSGNVCIQIYQRSKKDRAR